VLRKECDICRLILLKQLATVMDKHLIDQINVYQTLS
jgi:hypothetical protein